MTEPIVYVSTYRIKPGNAAEYARFYADLVRVVRANEPSLPAFLAFSTQDGGEITYVHVFPDAAALDRHMTILGEQMQLLPGDLKAVLAYLEPVRIDVFGSPSGAAAEMDAGLRSAGVPMSSKPSYLGGFTS